jgi:hypothetical protein
LPAPVNIEISAFFWAQRALPQAPKVATAFLLPA